jgi:hypothetical protein
VVDADAVVVERAFTVVWGAEIGVVDGAGDAVLFLFGVELVERCRALTILASAAYFAIYHPPISWLPVFCVLLGASVVLHLVYNAAVILLR